MIPIRDANPGLLRPVVTVAIVALNAFVFFFLQQASPDPEQFVYERATIPCEIISGQPLDTIEIETGECRDVSGGDVLAPGKSIPASLVYSLFMHGGIFHLLANLWVLWIFGNNVEDAFGRVGFLAFYLGAGLIASLAHVVGNPDSVVPVVGASGAIAGVMGAYGVLFPRARVVSIVPLFVFIPLAVPAWIFLGIWFVGQFALVGQLTNVAWEAHVAGFIIGVAAAAALRPLLRRRLRRHRLAPT